MKFLLLLLFILYSCETKNERQYSIVEIKDVVLAKYINKFITVSPFEEENSIIVTCQLRSDTSIFYLTGDREPDFTKANILGYANFKNLKIWIQGEKPSDRFISIKNETGTTSIIDNAKSNKILKNGHPLQWVIKFKNEMFLSCWSNVGGVCK